MTQARKRPIESAMRATGATSLKLVTSWPEGPAASATAWALSACWWVRRKPATPGAGAPNANRSPALPPAMPVVAAWAGKLWLAPSGNHAHALDSSCGMKTGRPAHPAWLAACCPGDPGDGADVVLSEPVAENGLGGIGVHLLAAQQRPDPGRPGHAQVAQPVLLLGLVGEQDLLRHLVDVGGRGPGNPHPSGADQRRVIRPPGEFLQAPVQEPGRADAIGPQQRGGGHPPLREAASVLSRGRRRMHVLQVDAVLEDVQHGGYVLADAGLKQLQDPPVAAQLRDLFHDQPVDVR